MYYYQSHNVPVNIPVISVFFFLFSGGRGGGKRFAKIKRRGPESRAGKDGRKPNVDTPLSTHTHARALTFSHAVYTRNKYYITLNTTIYYYYHYYCALHARHARTRDDFGPTI